MKQSNIRFVTLFPNCPNVGLVKDVGQIPYVLGKLENNIETKLVSSEIDFEGANIDKVKGLTIEKVPCVLHNAGITGCLYLLKNAKNIDWLNIYHGGRRCYYWTKLYKFLNPGGKVYIKMDLNYEGCRRYKENRRERKIFLKTSKVADIVSVESEKIQKLVKENTGFDVKILTNGYIDVAETALTDIQKEKIFITVGRLGTPEKATDLLLEAFAQSASEHDWKLKLVGTVEEQFNIYIKEYFEKYPELKNRVIFTGPIYEREKLYAEYRSARTFVLPSLWEASPLVGPEALYNGCRMILSDVIPPIKELTNDLKYGMTVKTGDIESLADALLRETRREYSDAEVHEIQQYAKENLMWNSICQRLYKMLVN